MERIDSWIEEQKPIASPGESILFEGPLKRKAPVATRGNNLGDRLDALMDGRRNPCPRRIKCATPWCDLAVTNKREEYCCGTCKKERRQGEPKGGSGCIMRHRHHFLCDPTFFVAPRFDFDVYLVDASDTDAVQTIYLKKEVYNSWPTSSMSIFGAARIEKDNLKDTIVAFKKHFGFAEKQKKTELGESLLKMEINLETSPSRDAGLLAHLASNYRFR